MPFVTSFATTQIADFLLYSMVMEENKWLTILQKEFLKKCGKRSPKILQETSISQSRAFS